MKRYFLIAAFAATGALHAQDITEYRWWVNDDIGTLTSASLVPATEVLLDISLDLPPLTKDYNTITYQFKDSNGAWSVPRTHLFSKSTGDVSSYEFWIDDAIDNATSGSIGPNTVVDLIADLPTGVPAGAHLFTIRFGGMNGAWTVPLTTQFESFVSIAELPGICDLLLFPNPISDQLGLRLSSEETRTLDLQVLDMTGAVVQDLSNWSVSGTAYRNWDISGLASGSYLLRVNDGTGTWSTHFVKQ